MKLYHGTTSKIIDKITHNGIIPRSVSKRSNWKHSVPSNPKCVYLTDTYPLYFAIHAARTHGKPTIVEIDTSKLNPFNLFPDEDVLEQAGRNYDNWTHLDMVRRTKIYRKEMFNYGPDAWRKSLNAMGTCAHLGTIPVKAITKIAIIDNEIQPRLCWTAMDASISLMNFKFCATKYKAITNWIFQYPYELSDFDKMTQLDRFFEDLDKDGRKGIEIIELD